MPLNTDQTLTDITDLVCIAFCRRYREDSVPWSIWNIVRECLMVPPDHGMFRTHQSSSGNGHINFKLNSSPITIRHAPWLILHCCSCMPSQTSSFIPTWRRSVSRQLSRPRRKNRLTMAPPVLKRGQLLRCQRMTADLVNVAYEKRLFAVLS